MHHARSYASTPSQMHNAWLVCAQPFSSMRTHKGTARRQVRACGRQQTDWRLTGGPSIRVSEHLG